MLNMKKNSFIKLLMAMMAVTVMACDRNSDTAPEELSMSEMIQRFYESTVVSSNTPELSNKQVILSGGIDQMGEGLTVKYGYAWMALEGGTREEVILGSTNEPMDIQVEVTDFPKDREIGFCILVKLEFRDEQIDDTGDIIESDVKTFIWADY